MSSSAEGDDESGDLPPGAATPGVHGKGKAKIDTTLFIEDAKRRSGMSGRRRKAVMKLLHQAHQMTGAHYILFFVPEAGNRVYVDASPTLAHLNTSGSIRPAIDKACQRIRASKAPPTAASPRVTQIDRIPGHPPSPPQRPVSPRDRVKPIKKRKVLPTQRLGG